MSRYQMIPFFALFILSTLTAPAQIWKRVQQKVEDKINRKIDEKVDGVLDGKDSSAKKDVAGAKKTGRILAEESVYAFTPGTQVIFQDNFSGEVVGRMPRRWKSSGGGSVVRLKGISGNWLSLSAQTTYRIDSLLKLSGRFTVEFDLLCSSEEAKDIGSMRFGFARDNSSRSYIMDAYNDNAITCTELHFWNKEVNNASSDTKINNTVDYPLENYANGIIHIAIEVDGQHLVVYVNQDKLLDADMFNKESPKYFYLSAPFEYEGDAKVYFGNLVIAK